MADLARLMVEAAEAHDEQDHFGNCCSCLERFPCLTRQLADALEAVLRAREEAGTIN